MQDRYAGDIGDFVKLGILRTLSRGRTLGVAWWRHPDETHNGDGRHIGYLDQPALWRPYDPDLFDGLRGVVLSGQRSVLTLEGASLLPDAIFHGEPVPTLGPPVARAMARGAWFSRLEAQVASRDLVFVDPDNGLETSRYSPTQRRAAKSVSLAELQALAVPGRVLVVYHHQTRRRGGHDAELRHWGRRLAQAGFWQVDALRARPFSARAFFLLNAPEDLRVRAAALAEAWSGVLAWRPDLHLGEPAAEAA